LQESLQKKARKQARLKKKKFLRHDHSKRTRLTRCQKGKPARKGKIAKGGKEKGAREGKRSFAGGDIAQVAPEKDWEGLPLAQKKLQLEKRRGQQETDTKAMINANGKHNGKS